jgi:hypothetical protein
MNMQAELLTFAKIRIGKGNYRGNKSLFPSAHELPGAYFTFVKKRPAALSTKSGSDFDLLAWSNFQVLPAGPDLIVEKDLERDRSRDGLRPTPCISIDTRQRNAMIPGQSRTFSP